MSSENPMRLLTGILLSAAAVGLLLAGCSKAPKTAIAADVKSHEDTSGPKTLQAAPDFTLKDSNGTTVHLSDYKGKVVVLDFWATWCGPCKIEIPWFMDFEKEFKNRGFAVLGVSLDEGGWDEVKPYIEERKINYRVVMGNDDITQAYTKVSQAIGATGAVDSLPTTFLIDRSGRIALVHVGLEKGKDDLRTEIEGLLKAAPGTSSSALLAVPAFVTARGK